MLFSSSALKFHASISMRHIALITVRSQEVRKAPRNNNNLNKKVFLNSFESRLWIHSTLCDLHEDEVIQEEELREEDQQEIETWTKNMKACTCDCESADSPTRTPAVIPTAPPTSLPPPQGHLLNCMPGEDSARPFHSRSCRMFFSDFWKQ